MTGRAAPLLAAGFFAGLAFDAHLAGLILWPALVLVSIAVVDRGAAKPAWVWAAGLAGALCAPMLLSPRSAGIAAASILNHLGWGGCIAAGLAGLAVAVGLRVVARKGEDRTRQRLVAVCVPIGTLACALMATSDFVEDPPARYTAPAYPALALAGAALAGVLLDRTSEPRRRVWFVALAVLVTLAHSLPAYDSRMAVDRDRWNYADVELLATWLREGGVGRGRVHVALRGGTCGGQLYSDRSQRLDELLVAGLRALGSLEPGAGSEPDRVWLVTKVRSSELPELPEDATTLGAGSRHTIVLVPDEPLLDLAGARGCARLDDGSTSCVAATPLQARLELRQVLPRHEWIPIPEGRRATGAYYELPLRGPRRGSRASSVALVGDDGRHTWRFAEVEGDVEVDASTRSEHTIDLRMEAGAEGLLRVEAEEVDEALGHVWWPPLLERPADPRTRVLFESLDAD